MASRGRDSPHGCFLIAWMTCNGMGVASQKTLIRAVPRAPAARASSDCGFISPKSGVPPQ